MLKLHVVAFFVKSFKVLVRFFVDGFFVDGFFEVMCFLELCAGYFLLYFNV